MEKCKSPCQFGIPINQAPVRRCHLILEMLQNTSEIMNEVRRVRGIDCYCPPSYMTALSGKCIFCPHLGSKPTYV